MTNPVAAPGRLPDDASNFPRRGGGVLRSRLVIEKNFLRAEMKGRETAEETGQFLKEVSGAMLEQDRDRVLVVVRESRAIFKVEDYGLSDYFKAMAAKPGRRIALVGDSSESYAAHGYIELLARQRSLPVRAFRDEAEALEWLLRDD